MSTPQVTYLGLLGAGARGLLGTARHRGFAAALGALLLGRRLLVVGIGSGVVARFLVLAAFVLLIFFFPFALFRLAFLTLTFRLEVE